MSDRVKGLILTFDHSVRDDDAEVYVSALRLLRGVIGVEVSLDSFDDQMNRARIREEIREKLWEALDE